MNVFTNEAYLKQQKRRATLIQTAGLGAVLLSFILSFFYIETPILIFLAYPALLVGWPLWLWARGRSRYADQALKTAPLVSEEFKGLNNKYTLFHALVIDKVTFDHVLVSPDGILVIEMKEGGALVTCRTTDKGDQWRSKAGPIDRLARFGEEPAGNPTVQLDAQIATLRAWLAAQGITRTPLPLAGVVAFRNPATPLDIQSSKYDVLRLNELKAYVLEGPPEAKRTVLLPTDERNRIVAALRGLLPAAVEPEKEKPGSSKRPERSDSGAGKRAARPDPGATQPLPPSARPGKR